MRTRSNLWTQLLLVYLIAVPVAVAQTTPEGYSANSLGVKGGSPFASCGGFYLFEVDSSDGTVCVIAVDSYPEYFVKRATILSVRVGSNSQLFETVNLRVSLGLGDLLLQSDLPRAFDFTFHVGVAIETFLGPKTIALFSLEKPVRLNFPQPFIVSAMIGVRMVL